MADTKIEEGCTVLDSDDKAWRVLEILEPEVHNIDGFEITVVSAKVTDGVETATRLLGELDRAEMTTVGHVIARGYR